MRTGELIPGQAGLDLVIPGDAVTDRYKILWIKGEDSIWRSRERVPASASTSRLLRLQVGPFRFCGQPAAGGDAVADGRTHVGHDDINAASPSRRP